MSMYPFFHMIKKTYALLALVILVIAFSACGANNAANPNSASNANSASGNVKSSDATVTSSVTSMPRTKSLANLLAPNKDNVALDVDGLHIQESSALHCLSLVLASNRLTYDQGEIQQMSQFLKYFGGFYSPGDNRLLPSTLRWEEGGSANIPGSCSATFQITNTGNTTIQISRVGLRIKQTPLPNTYVYRLINVCSFLPSGPVCNGGNGGVPGPCGEYYVNLSLKNARLNDVIGDTPVASSNNSCPELTLTPRMSTELEISVGGPSFIYSVLPEFSVITAQGQQTLALPAFTSVVAFSTQFPCYTLQDTSLVLMKNLASSRCI